MTNSSQLDPSPFVLANSSVGALLIHGLTASPTEMHLVGRYLHERGLTLAAPLLPGHGTNLADLRKQRWQDWVQHADAAFVQLKSRCEFVFVAGISLGSLVALHPATEHADVRGLIVYSPLVKMPGGAVIHLVPLLKHVAPEIPKAADFATDPTCMSRMWSYQRVSLLPYTRWRGCGTLLNSNWHALPARL